MAEKQVTEKEPQRRGIDKPGESSLRGIYAPRTSAAAIGFHVVHAIVGGADDGVDCVAVGGSSGHADAGAHGELQAILHAEAGRHQRAQQAGGTIERLLRTGLGHQNHKLVAAVAEAQVLLAAEFLEPLPGARQQLAADQMAVRVIDQLEAVQIKEGQAYGKAEAAAAFQLPAEHIVKMAHVEEPGGVVGDGELLDAGHVARVFNGDGRVVGKDVQEGDGVVGELLGAGIEDLNRAVRAFAAAQRQGDDRTHFWAPKARQGHSAADRLPIPAR